MRNAFFAVVAILPVAFVSCVTFSSLAQAREHHHSYQHHHSHHADVHHGRHLVARDGHRAVAQPGCRRCGSLRTAWHLRGSHYRFHGHHAPAASSTNLASVGGTLATKAHEIVASCGSTVISGFRAGARIAGTNHASMHASGRAVDVRGNPGCIYAHLHGWAGGYSTDYASVRHVHISLGGREDGLRFSHHSSRHAHLRLHGDEVHAHAASSRARG